MAHSASTLGLVFTPGPGTGYLRPEPDWLKIIGVEEHAAFPEIMRRTPNEDAAKHARNMIAHMTQQETVGFAPSRVTDIGTQRVSDMDDAGIAMQVLRTTGANDTDYGLFSAVFTDNLAAGLRIARGYESGAVHINGTTIRDVTALPHGGVKKSGFGRFNGLPGLDELLRSKVVTWKGLVRNFSA